MTNVIRKAIDDSVSEAIKDFKGKIVSVSFRNAWGTNEIILEICTPLLNKYPTDYNDWSIVQDEAGEIGKKLSQHLGGEVDWTAISPSGNYIFTMIV